MKQEWSFLLSLVAVVLAVALSGCTMESEDFAFENEEIADEETGLVTQAIDFDPVESHCDISCAPIPEICHREGAVLSGACSRVTCGTVVCSEPMADLVIDSIAVYPPTPLRGIPVIFLVKVTNVDEAMAPASEASLRVGGETFPDTYSIPALGPGQSYYFFRVETINSTGAYRATAEVDTQYDVDEINEWNNVRFINFNVIDY